MDDESQGGQIGIVSFLESLGVFVALNAAALGMASVHFLSAQNEILSTDLKWYVFGVIFGLTMTTYNVDHWRDRHEDAKNRREASVWMRLNRPMGLLVVMGPLIFSVWAVMFGSEVPMRMHALGLLTFLFLAGLFYAVPLPIRSGFRFKRLPYFKSLYVSSVWGLAMLFPGLMVGHLSSPVLAFACYIFLRMIPACNLGDVRDEVADHQAGLKTLPVILKIRKLAIVMQGINGLAVLWLVLAVALGWLEPSALIMVVGCVVASLLWVGLLTRKISATLAQSITFFELMAIWPLVVTASYLKMMWW